MLLLLSLDIVNFKLKLVIICRILVVFFKKCIFYPRRLQCSLPFVANPIIDEDIAICKKTAQVNMVLRMREICGRQADNGLLFYYRPTN